MSIYVDKDNEIDYGAHPCGLMRDFKILDSKERDILAKILLPIDEDAVLEFLKENGADEQQIEEMMQRIELIGNDKRGECSKRLKLGVAYKRFLISKLKDSSLKEANDYISSLGIVGERDRKEIIEGVKYHHITRMLQQLTYHNLHMFVQKGGVNEAILADVIDRVMEVSLDHKKRNNL